MNNPIKIFRELQNVYLKYINSGLPFSREEYTNERNELMNEPGTICQPPIIELVPKYHEKATLKEFCLREGVSSEINDFVNTGLFVNNKHSERKLYDHQYDALREAFVYRKHMIVTTGTGSGKTECFLLPVIADLVTESASWQQDRPRAMRTMILYPLNALAEDQMIRLRKALNSRTEDKSGALDWLDEHRNHHRFYFGRYTGSTPVSGTKKKAQSKYYEEKKQLTQEWEAAKEAAKENSPELLYHVPCMESDSAEMWDRFSMQDNAPDIMITNYSMLNVILMRDLESGIFEDTKKWLQQDKNNVFHLVIDELHTYRGTAGTEVAYLIRVLLDRLGLTPESSQVQFLASSASMEQNAQTEDYLCGFFGISKETLKNKFVILSNPEQSIIQQPQKSIPCKELADYSINTSTDEVEKQKQLFTSLGVSSFKELTDKYELLDWLKYSLSTDSGVIAKDVEKIAVRMDIPERLGNAVVESIVKIICQSTENGNVIAPLRSHFFFRSINGLWGCSDPNCSCTESQYNFEGRTIGKLYKRPRTVCDCGKRVLEVLICENCGEVFLGGYKIIKDGKSYLTVEKPISEAFCNYCVLWKGEGATTEDGWFKANYNEVTGEYSKSPNGEYYVYEQRNDSDTCFPHKCPQCEVAYRVKDKNSFTPVRRHSAGLQKINQILADSLIRSMKNENESNTKVVLFSDSRQSAAKLSAGIELDHFRDVLRWAILNALKGDNSAVTFLKSIRGKGASMTPEEGLKLRELAQQQVYNSIVQKIMFENMGILLEKDKVELDKFFNSIDALLIDNIEENVFKTLLSIGSNPAGPMPSVANDMNAGVWFDLFDFDNNKIKDGLVGAKNTFAQRIVRRNKTEQLISIFSNKNNSFEELKLGYLVPTALCPDVYFRELVSSVIRIMGEKRRIKDVSTKYVHRGFPLQVRKYIKHVCHIQGQKELNEKLDEIKNFLINGGILDRDEVLLNGGGLSFVKSNEGSDYWECPRCKTIHMQHSNGVCVNCMCKLGDPKKLSKEDITNPNDYYLTLLNSTEEAYRLHCEELTGQTNKSDSRKRQRLFQDIFLKTENAKIDGIDLLSVTTTMEAGVDIGSLSAVMMGNVPPQRFNYQQRVGRAGRRGNPLSLAITVARGNSHDLTHFFETERMVSDTPKDPYLEVRTREIAERIIYKEILYHAIGSFKSGGNDSVHGNFGSISEWSANMPKVQEWITNNPHTVHHVINVVTCGTELTEKQKKEIYDFINSNLVEKITGVVNSDEFTQDNLSERLANAGMLPMFGFPTRTRNLYLSDPKKLPAEDVVSRDMDMALNSFAPGHEIVKDKKVYKAVGVVEYEYNTAHIVTPKFNSLNKYKQPLHRCKHCGYSTITSTEDVKNCPVCGQEMEKVKICSPLGFCVDYSVEPEDFNGSFDWYSPNSDIKLDCEESLAPCPKVHNLIMRNNLIPSSGLVHLVNDNNGDYYRMGLNSEGIYISRDAYPEEIANNLKLEFESKYAFVSSKTTGVLTLGIDKVPNNICLIPINEFNDNSFAVRAAFLSWGFLARKAVSSYLDIDSSELTVGYYISPKTQKAEIFFVERLENGAGYCNFLSGRKYKEIPLKAIIAPLVEGGNIYKQLAETNHSRECVSSCYDCIRDYSNQQYHNLLDWRLGLDIARLADDPHSKIDFTVSYWREYVNITLFNILKQQGFSVESKNDTLLAKDKEGNMMCLIHPLWSKQYISKIVGAMPANTKPLSVFELSKLTK